MAGQSERRIDDYLVVSARLGDRRAFARLAIRWQKKLLVHAWRLLRDDEAAKDAVQDAWAEIVRGLKNLRDERAFGAWAYRIVTRRCARQVGKKRESRMLQEALLADAATVPQSAGPSSADGDIERMRQAIRALPPQQQATLALYYFEELSVGEVAVALDVPVGTVKTRLLHARRSLNHSLSGEE
jgi:RNA polymerase sigma-70 factor (ECF subfamily)